MKRLALFLILAACGGAQTGGSTEPSDVLDCPYTMEDSCIDEAALAACEAASVECPGQVQVMESCPLQFGCGGSTVEGPDDPTPFAEPCVEGESRPDDDGCNTCTCAGGIWSCTEMGCEAS